MASDAARAAAALEDRCKAIGWVLGETGKRRRDEVFAWLAPRTQRVSGVTVREAVRYFEPDQREQLLAAYQEQRPAQASLRFKG
jgi:DNA alkylation repair enzyme